jgi:predicted amidophosphoribosyltransferase
MRPPISACVRCGYDLAGVGSICPECGQRQPRDPQVFDHEALRTRRIRWTVTVAALCALTLLILVMAWI